MGVQGDRPELPERPTEYSAIDALARVSALYAAANKKLTIEVQVADPEMQALHPQASPKLVNVVSEDEPQVAVA